MPAVPTDTPDRRRVVVILGGGFAGVGAVRALKGSDVDVVLVDSHDYHTFQPLLYQVATDLLETSAVGHPLRDLFHDLPNVTVHQAMVSSVDLDARRVGFAELAPVDYDYLVLALGAHVEFFGVQGAAQHSFPLYTLEDAVRLRAHVLRCWEAADKDPDAAADGARDVVVVGGGPTGVESAGAFAELYRGDFAHDYPHVAPGQARIRLVEAGPALLGMFKADIRTYAKRALEKRGVEVLLGEQVASVTPTRVTLASGTVLAAHTLVWGAGLRASALTGSLGVALERADRVPVAPDLSIAGHSEAFAVGDIAWISDADGPLPQLGSVALQSGERAGANIARLLAGRSTEPFAYNDKGTMATIGRGAAVVQLRRGRTIKGKTAALAWGAVHLALLSTGEDRAKAAIDWTWAGFTHERSGRIVVDTPDEERVPSALPTA